jgi:hypothetical protein
MRSSFGMTTLLTPSSQLITLPSFPRMMLIHTLYNGGRPPLFPSLRNWLGGYITVMYITGPLFLLALWVQYLQGMKGNPNSIDRVKVLVKGGPDGGVCKSVLVLVQDG